MTRRNFLTERSPHEKDILALERLKKKQVILFACDLAHRVLNLFEKVYPNDKRPRDALAGAEQYALYDSVHQKTLVQLVKASTCAANSALNREKIEACHAARTCFRAAEAGTHDAQPAYFVASAAASFVYAYPPGYDRVRWDSVYALWAAAMQPFPAETYLSLEAKGVLETILATRDFSLMPVLADALEDAGYTYSILDYLRGPGTTFGLSNSVFLLSPRLHNKE